MERDWREQRVPLAAAEAILSAFEIQRDNAAYQLWRRSQDFRYLQLEEVLAHSPRILNVDWKDHLRDPLEEIVRQVRSIGVAALVDVDLDVLKE